jgi:hypothetical protein
MRKYHRWLSVVFGAFLLWIAATGVMIQLADLKAASEEEAEAGPAPQAGAVQVSRAQQGSNAGLVVKATFICPAVYPSRGRTAQNLGSASSKASIRAKASARLAP